MGQKDESKKKYKMAEPFRAALQLILRTKIKTKSEREYIAKTLNVALQTINNALYEGKGGFDLLVSMLVVSYKMEDVPPEKLAGDVKTYLRKNRAASPTDQMKNELDRWMTQEEQFHWFQVGKAMKQLELSIMPKSKKKTSEAPKKTK